MNRQQRRKRKPKKKPLKSRRELTDATLSITIGCCLLTMNDLYGVKTEDELKIFFARYNENMQAFNEGRNSRKMLNLINTVKEECHGLDVTKL